MNQKLSTKNHTSHFTLHTSQKGITLIALAVTVIVLAILAGVTINMVLGDEGIITQANQEKDNQERETDIENITLIVAEEDFKASMDGRTRNVSNVDTGLDNKFKKNVGVRSEGEDLVVTVGSDREYKVDKYGKVSVWTGATTAPITTATATPTPTPTPTPVPTPTSALLISFGINGTTYSTHYGTTWRTFINQGNVACPYCINGLDMNEKLTTSLTCNTFTSMDEQHPAQLTLNSNSSNSISLDSIIESGEYFLSVDFTVDGESYRVQAGSLWTSWISQNYNCRTCGRNSFMMDAHNLGCCTNCDTYFMISYGDGSNSQSSNYIISGAYISQ